MYKGKKFLAVITARGGSKGLPRKNIRELCGKPLIAWTIEQAKNSKYLDRAIVSTDDEEIAEISKKYGGDVPFLRPKELALDTTSSIDVLQHIVDFLHKIGERYDYVMLLQPTSPLRKEEDIDNSIRLLIDNEDKADSLVSMGEVKHEHPIFLYRLDDTGYITPFIDKSDIVNRRQDIREKVYFSYGMIYISKIDKLFEENTFYQKKTIPYLIERWQCYDIDDIYDFLCVEAIMKSIHILGGEEV